MLNEKSKPAVLTLSRGADRCDLVPSLGGSIADWSVNGQAMMRRASSFSINTNDPYGMASFPLVPYSNRVGGGTFEWDGKTHSLARNLAPEPHSIHGVGFERPWQVRDQARDSVTLVLSHRPSASWPFAFEAEQRVSLEEGVLLLELKAHNLCERAVPLAFGHHPYFPRGGASLKFRAQGVWLNTEEGLPSLMVKPFEKFDHSNFGSVARGEIDHCYVGWDGRAEVRWLDRPLALEICASESLPCAVVCIRNDLDGFCFEPVPHLNDAVNHPGRDCAMPVIGPKQSFSASIRFRAYRTARTSR
jgi:aldose 1-epimerase